MGARESTPSQTQLMGEPIVWPEGTNSTGADRVEYCYEPVPDYGHDVLAAAS
jgi:hypothetical protein